VCRRKIAIDPGEGWRLLEEDEEIESGDEWQNTANRKWFIVVLPEGTKVRGNDRPYRRKIQPPEPELPEGYEFCERDELDQWCQIQKRSGAYGKWFDNDDVDVVNAMNNQLRYCRKIKLPQANFDLTFQRIVTDDDCACEPVKNADIMKQLRCELGGVGSITFPLVINLSTLGIHLVQYIFRGVKTEVKVWVVEAKKPEPGFVDVVPELDQERDGDKPMLVIKAPSVSMLISLSEASDHVDFLGYVWGENSDEVMYNHPVLYRAGTGTLFSMWKRDRKIEVCKAVRFKTEGK